MAMPAWSKRLLFPCSFMLVIAIMIWQYKASNANAYPAESTYRNESIDIRIRTDDAPVRLLEETTFYIHVQDSKGYPVNDASIQLTITMPSMYCGEFQAKITSIGDGSYEARVAPVMSGAWEAETVIRAGDRSYTVKHRFATDA